MSPNSFAASQCAAVAPTLPAPTTVILFRAPILCPFRDRVSCPKIVSLCFVFSVELKKGDYKCVCRSVKFGSTELVAYGVRRLVGAFFSLQSVAVTIAHKREKAESSRSALKRQQVPARQN